MRIIIVVTVLALVITGGIVQASWRASEPSDFPGDNRPEDPPRGDACPAEFCQEDCDPDEEDPEDEDYCVVEEGIVVEIENRLPLERYELPRVGSWF